MDTYGAADFKAHCLAILDEVALSGKEVRVMKRGKPLARIVPDVGAEDRPAYGFMRGTAVWDDGLLSAEAPWDADRS